MRKSTRAAVAAAAAFGLVAVSYGAATAGATHRTPKTPRPAAAPAQFVPHAGPGTSPHPPARPDSLYVPMKTCRLVNTHTAGGKLAKGASRSFYVVGGGNFRGQGGPSSGCRIPSTATAISARLTAFGGTASGGIAAYATGATSGQTVLFYPKATAVSTGATLPLADGTGKVLTVSNSGGPTHLIIDVNGYYDEQMQGMITPSGSVYSGSNHIVSASLVATGVYRVTFDRDVTYCTPMIDTYSGRGVYGSGYAFSANAVTVYTWYLDSTTHRETANSYYFYITMSC